VCFRLDYTMMTEAPTLNQEPFVFREIISEEFIFEISKKCNWSLEKCQEIIAVLKKEDLLSLTKLCKTFTETNIWRQLISDYKNVFTAGLRVDFKKKVKQYCQANNLYPIIRTMIANENKQGISREKQLFPLLPNDGLSTSPTNTTVNTTMTSPPPPEMNMSFDSTTSNEDNSLQQVLYKAGEMAKIPQAKVDEALTLLNQNGVYTLDIFKLQEESDLKPMIGVGLWKSVELLLKPKEGRRHKKKEVVTVKSLQNKLNEFSKKTNQPQYAFTATTTTEVKCTICDKFIKLHKEGALSNLKKHVDGQRQDVVTNHCKRLADKEPGLQLDDKKRKRQSLSPTDRNKKSTAEQRRNLDIQTGLIHCDCLKPACRYSSNDGHIIYRCNEKGCEFEKEEMEPHLQQHPAPHMMDPTQGLPITNLPNMEGNTFFPVTPY